MVRVSQRSFGGWCFWASWASGCYPLLGAHPTGDINGEVGGGVGVAPGSGREGRGVAAALGAVVGSAALVAVYQAVGEQAEGGETGAGLRARAAVVTPLVDHRTGWPSRHPNFEIVRGRKHGATNGKRPARASQQPEGGGRREPPVNRPLRVGRDGRFPPEIFGLERALRAWPPRLRGTSKIEQDGHVVDAEGASVALCVHARGATPVG